MADEKIRLNLDVSGVQDVKALKDAMEDLAQAMGVVDYKFDAMGTSAQGAAGGINDLNDAATSATGGGKNSGRKGGGGGGGGGANNKSAQAAGMGLLNLAYAIDDVQYGLRGVMNNLPSVVAAFGGSAGLGAAAMIGAVAIQTLMDKFPELLKYFEKTTEKVGNLADPLNKFKENLEQIKNRVEELGKAEYDEAGAVGELLRLRKQQEILEEQIADRKKNQAAAEKIAKSEGKEADTLKAEKTKAFNDAITDAGLGKTVTEELQKAILAEMQKGITDDSIKELVKKLYKDEIEAMYDAHIVDAVPTMSKEEAANRIFKKHGEKARNDLLEQVRKRSEEEAGQIIGKLTSPDTVDEQIEAFGQFQRFAPGQAGKVENKFQASKQAKQDAIAKQEAEKQAAIGPTRQMFEDNQLRTQEKEAREKERAKDKKETLDKRELDQQVNQLEQEFEEFVRQDDRRVSIRDKAMQRYGINPMGLAVEAQNSVVGRGKQAEQARQAARNQQNQQLQAMFQQGGMNAQEAEKSASEVMQASNKAIQSQLQANRVIINSFGQLQQNVQQLMREMQRQQAGQRQPRFQGGARDN